MDEQTMSERVGAAIEQIGQFSLSSQMVTGQDPSTIRATVMTSMGHGVFGPATIAECHAYIRRLKGRVAIEAMRTSTDAMDADIVECVAERLADLDGLIYRNCLDPLPDDMREQLGKAYWRERARVAIDETERLRAMLTRPLPPVQEDADDEVEEQGIA